MCVADVPKKKNGKKTLLEQTAVLTASNVAVRALGFWMRIWFSRVMGAEAVGLMELASSAHMLWITPVTAGLPLAVSSTVAQGGDARAVLLAARRLVMRVCRVMLPLLLVFSPWIARLLGDARTLPALWAFLPCLPILGLSAAYNGYCYGIGTTVPQALSEIVEQGLRFLVSAALLYGLRNATIAWTAAMPAAATAIGEAVGVVLVAWMLQRQLRGASRKRDAAMEQKLWRLSLPVTGIRILNTGVRTLSAIIIPLRLRASGLAAAEAIARLGMLQGMALPLLLMPSVFTGALAMVSAPALASRKRDRSAMRALAWRLLPAAAGISLLSAAVVYGAAPLIATRLYRQPDLFPLLRALTPLVVVFGVQQVCSSLLAGLGLQRKVFIASLLGALFTLALTWIWAAMPSFRLMGCAYAMIAGQSLTVLLNLSQLFAALGKGLGVRG